MMQMSRISDGTAAEQPGLGMMRFFDGVAARYDACQRMHFYYHRLIENVFLSSIPPRSSVIDLGCGTGQLLARLEPAQACGVDFSPAMIGQAQERLGSGVMLCCEPLETFTAAQRFDYAVISNTLEYVNDIDSLLIKAYGLLNEGGRIVITSINPLWRPVLRLASVLHLRTPDVEKNFLTNKDVANFLEGAGFEIVEEGVTGTLPLYIPLLVPFLNLVFSHMPFLRQTGIVQYVVARKRTPPRDYHCSIIVPCYNEAGNIKSIIRETPLLGLSTELVFVDDGSQDGTAGQVDASLRRDIAVRCVSYQPNRGKSHAVMQGFQAAQGELLFILDADISVHPEELRKCYRILARGDAEFINCTRTIYPMEGKAMKIANYVGNKLFCLLVSWIIGQRVTDTLCGTKVMFKKHLANFSLGHDPWGDYDFLFCAAKLRLKMRDVAVHYRERRYGSSKMSAFTHAFFLLKACFWGMQKMKFPLVSIRKAQFS
jgi:SAM-dependent methyltransferase